MDHSGVIRITDLHVAYGQRSALEEVSCVIHDRRVTAVVGPSGCGKSTLLRSMNRTLELIPGARITRGEITHRGENIHDSAHDAQELRKRIGLIHQKPVPFPLSIRENVLFGVRFHGHWDDRSADEAAREHLEQAGLWEEVKDRLGESATALSGGQQQRLCIARTLANRPEVILMDEPCSSLDARSTRQIEELIARLRERLTFVVVTHNLAQAQRIAQDAIVLLDGRVAEKGEAAATLTEPADARAREYVQGFIG